MLYQHSTGRRPISMNAAIAYAKAFGCAVEEISPRQAMVLREAEITGTLAATETGSDVMDSQMIQIDRLAISGSMGFGEALAEHEDVIHRISLDMSYVRKHLQGVSSPGNLKVISGHGHSMAPTINDGDLVLVDTGIRSVNVDGIYVLSANDRLYIKSVRQRMNGQYEIYSDNPAVKTVDILNGDFQVTIHGRVVMVWNGKRV